MSAARTIQGATCLMKYIRSAVTFGICGRYKPVVPHTDQHAGRFRIPHCTTTIMEMLLIAHIVSLQKVVQKSNFPVSSLSAINPNRKPSNQMRNLSRLLAV